MHVSEFKPTVFDHGIGCWLPDQTDWLVVPVSQNRDSGCLDQSNFAIALELLGGESETVDVHRFGHWANGWYELIIVAPSRADDVARITARLEDCPVLSDDDLYERETAAIWDSWDNMSLAERCAFAVRNGHSRFAARRGPFECDNSCGDAVYKLIAQ